MQTSKLKTTWRCKQLQAPELILSLLVLINGVTMGLNAAVNIFLYGWDCKRTVRVKNHSTYFTRFLVSMVVENHGSHVEKINIIQKQDHFRWKYKELRVAMIDFVRGEERQRELSYKWALLCFRISVWRICLSIPITLVRATRDHVEWRPNFFILTIIAIAVFGSQYFYHQIPLQDRRLSLHSTFSSKVYSFLRENSSSIRIGRGRCPSLVSLHYLHSFLPSLHPISTCFSWAPPIHGKRYHKSNIPNSISPGDHYAWR